jgi:hypothetical protein
MRPSIAIVAAVAIAAGFARVGATAAADFSNPQMVTIGGYTGGDAMEPFLTRDGSILFFNNSNSAPDTNLYWATKVDDLTFNFMGEIGGVNSAALDGVASMDLAGDFFFISTRSYVVSSSTIFRGAYSNGIVSGAALVNGVSKKKPGWVNFDCEISADGNTLYFIDGFFGSKGFPQNTKWVIAHRAAGGFQRDPKSGKILHCCRSSKSLNYAPDTSADELEFYWTRFVPPATPPEIFMASRASKSKPFEKPHLISAITGFAEAPSLSPDGHSLYYHHMDGGAFNVWRVTR